MCNASFLLFDATLSYESFALPLAAVALVAMVRRQHAGDESVGPWRVVIALAIGGVIVSHHMTSYGAIIVLLAWTLMEFAIRKFAPQRAVQFGPKWVATSTVLAYTHLTLPT